MKTLQTMEILIALFFGLSPAMLGGCSDRTVEAADSHEHPAQSEPQHDEHADHDDVAASADPSRIAISESVRQNLGITFAQVEQRRVASTIRVPGRFELTPSARREYQTVLPGRVELRVQQYQPVEAGTLLYRLESPEWLKLRQQLQEELLAITKTEVAVTVAEATKTETEQAVAKLRQRVEALSSAGVRRAELEADLADKKNSLPRLDAEIRAKQAEHHAAQQRFSLTLASAASLLGMPPQALAADVGTQDAPKPRWSSIDAVEVKAAQAGVVETIALTNGTWIEAHKPVLTTVNPKDVRFRAVGLQADLGKLREGLPACITPPKGDKAEAEALPGKLAMGLEADPESRTLALIVVPEQVGCWARAGVSAFLEVALNDNEEAELAIPLAAVIQDDLTKVFFRRDPKNPDQVIRVEADLGASDGQWVVVNSGVKAGDQVVVDGVYELKLASSGKAAPSSGHFHADGTFHEGDKH